MNKSDLEILDIFSPLERIDWLVKRLNVVKKVQLYRFFSDANVRQPAIDTYIDTLVKKHLLEYYEPDDLVISKDIIAENNGKLYIKYPERKRIKSFDMLDTIANLFWIPATDGSFEVRDAMLLRRDPAQIVYLTSDMAYQVVSIQSQYDSRFFHTELEEYRFQPTDENDPAELEKLEIEIESDYYRIALVPDEQTGRTIKHDAFDCFAVLDENNVPYFWSYDD